MKIYINNRNYLTWPKKMAEILLNQNHHVIIVDNDSTYKPLLDWYENEKEIEVIKLNLNGGHTAPWKYNVVDKSNFYAVTDPDLDISDIPNNWDDLLKFGLNKYNCGKAGFSLCDKGIPKENPAWIYDEFFKYPNGYNPTVWGNHIKLCDNFFNFPVDTTFAVYSPGINYFIGGIRSNEPYTAKHLPWHIVLKKNEQSNSFQIEMDDEIYYYFKNASSYSTTAGRLKDMLLEYEKFN